MKTFNKELAGWNAQTPYALQYTHNGGVWALTIFAVDEVDAIEKLASIKRTIELLGPIDEVIEVKP